jgi:hypothetical protein
MNKDFKDLIKINWKSREEVAEELREELKRFEQKCKTKKK